MIGFIFAVLGTVLLDALALGSVLLWIGEIFRGITHDQQGTLRLKHVSAAIQSGSITSMCVIVAPAIYSFAYINLGNHTPWMITAVLVYAGILGSLTIILWILTLYLKLRPKQPLYLFHLPEDANKLRLTECIQGIICVAQTFPQVIEDREILEALTRASQVAIRMQIRTKGGEWQITNNFATHCSICIEAVEQGYYGFFKECLAALDHLKDLRTTLQDWPDTPEAREAANAIARRLLNLDKKEM